MRPIRIFKAETFRLAALFALLFLILTGVLIGTVLCIVDRTQRATLMGENDNDIATVMNGFRDEGLDEAVEVVQQRLGTIKTTSGRKLALPLEVYMAIVNQQGALAGNMPAVSCKQGIFEMSLAPVSEHRPSRSVLGRCVQISPGLSLFVGRDTRPLSVTRERILHAFAWVAFGTCGFAILFGLFLGKRFMRRVDVITRTCERIILGRLNERIALRGEDDEWDRLARAINEMLDRISALMENLKQVSSDVAHDLRTPLTRLRNRLEQARIGSRNMEDYSGAIGSAIGDMEQLLSMFSALLRISQVEAGTRAQAFAGLCLTDILEKVYQLYQPLAEDLHHVLSRDLRGNVWIQGDVELLTQLFSNLIENSIHHTPEGAHIQLTLSLHGDRAVAAVIDDGPGIPVEEREKVLRRFYRISNSRSTEGNGLGLSLVAAVAQLHGAQLELGDGRPGLRVTMTFPPLT